MRLLLRQAAGCFNTAYRRPPDFPLRVLYPWTPPGQTQESMAEEMPRMSAEAYRCTSVC